MSAASPFDPSHHNAHDDVAAKLVVALERIATAYRVMQWNQAKDMGLQPIQLQVLTFLHFHPAKHCTVTALAAEFALTKASMSDTVKSLEQKGLVGRAADPADARSHYLFLTDKGKAEAAAAPHYADAMLPALDGLDAAAKEKLLEGLLSVIQQLHAAGIITVQRMCQTCAHFQPGSAGAAHYCRFLQQPLAVAALRLDCPEHQLA